MDNSNHCATPVVDASPGPNDILLGKGHHRNPGNCWLKKYVHQFKEEYQQMSRESKGLFLKRIIKSVYDTGRCFYLKDDNGDKWNVINMEDRSVTNLGSKIIQQYIANMINRRDDASQPPDCQQPSPLTNSTPFRHSNDEVTFWIEPYCVVELPARAAAGDQLLIRWPKKGECNQIASHGKKTKEDTGDDSAEDKIVKKETSSTSSSISKQSSSSSVENVVTQKDVSSSHKRVRDDVLLVRILLPSKLPVKRRKKGSPCYIKVVAPWLAAERAASNSLNTRQLRSIGIDDHSLYSSNLCPNQRQERKKNHGEGNIVNRTTSRVGRQYQVCKSDLPTSDTWAVELHHVVSTKERDERENSTADYDQIWSRSRAEKAASQGENIERYINSLKPFQKAHGMMTLHQSNYKVHKAEEIFDSNNETDTINSHSLLEGTPLSHNERIIFNEAIDEHDKQWHKIAKSVGTTPSRCLVHYYSHYKWGDERDRYLQNKKRWEQSDYCEICDDGGDLLCCDGCSKAYHMDCIRLPELPEGDWYCPECQTTKITARNGVSG